MVQTNPSAEDVHCSTQYATSGFGIAATFPLTRWFGLDGRVWLSAASMRLTCRAGCASVAKSIYVDADVSGLPASLCLAVAGKY